MGEAIQEAAKRVDREINPEVAGRRNALFEKFILPYKNLIYWCCKQYSDAPENVRENYALALTNLFRGIETYDPEKSIQTWIHIVTRRYVMNINKSRYNEKQLIDPTASCDTACYNDKPSWKEMTVQDYKKFYNDEIVAALDSMKPIYRDALLLQQAGYSLVEIANIEFEKGTLNSRNIDTVKSRLFLARQHMKKRITRYGNKKID